MDRVTDVCRYHESLKYECLGDLLGLGIHSVFILLTSIFLIVKYIVNKQRRISTEERKWILLPLHYFRWTLLFILIPCHVLLFTEGILANTWTSYVVYILAPLGAILTFVVVNFVEKNNDLKSLVIPLVYWICCVLIEGLKLSAHVESLSWTTSARFLFVAISGIVYTLFLITEVIVLIKLKYLCKTSPLHAPDELQKVKYVQPYVCFLSQITWHWLTSFLGKGYKKALTLPDLGILPKTEHSRKNYDELHDIYMKEVERAKRAHTRPSLWRCYWHFSGRLLSLTGLMKIISDQMVFVGPMLTDFIVTFAQDIIDDKEKNITDVSSESVYAENSTSPVLHHVSLEVFLRNGFVLAVIMTMATVLQTTMFQNTLYLCAREGIRVKGAIQSMVYAKSLKLVCSSLTNGQLSQGQVINHMSIDSLNTFMLFYLGHFGWAMPLQVFTGLVLLYIQLGISALIGGLLIIGLVPAQYLIARRINKLQTKLLHQADSRLKQSNELLQSIKLVKLYAWETLFSNKILETRNKELRLLLKVALLRISSLVVCDIGPLVGIILTFTLYHQFNDEPLTGGRVFSSIAILGILSMCLYIITLVITIISFGFVSTRRIEKYLTAEEVERGSVSSENSQQFDNTIPEVKVVNGGSTEKSPVIGSPDYPISYEMSDLGSQEIVLDEHSTTLQNTEHSHLLADHNMKIDGFKDPVNEEKYSSVNLRADKKGDDTLLEIDNLWCSWEKDTEKENTVLKDISFSIKKGELCMIVGTVSSGKSSLLSALMGEMFMKDGKLQWNGDPQIAYVPQRSWLLNATLQENVLFGREMDPRKYEDVQEMCALKPDIQILPAGDQTEIGEKGVNLSGGQKQRISLARAVYSGADVIFMDDPISALDAPVAHHIFTKLIQGYLRDRGCTVILVTHQIQYLNFADKIISMQDGKIIFQGTASQLRESDVNIMELADSVSAKNKNKRKNKNIRSPGTHTPPSKSKENLNDYEASEGLSLAPRVWEIRSAVSLQSLGQISQYAEDNDYSLDKNLHRKVSHISQPGKAVDVSEKGKLIVEEEHNMGAVGASVYLAYIRAATWFLVLGTLIGYILRQALRTLCDYWLVLWVQAASHITDFTNTSFAVNETLQTTLQSSSVGYDLEYYVKWYLVIGLLTSLISLVAYVSVELMSLNAARTLFANMLKKITTAPMRFFDTTPLGRILNRMSGDTNIIDEKMAVSHDQVLYCTLICLAGIVVNAVSTPYFIIPAIPMFVIFFVVQRFYIVSSRELQRLDSITKSPILTHFSETLSGLTSIRAYRDENRFQSRLWHTVDENNRAFLYFHTTNVWMGIRLDYLGAFMVFAASISSLAACLHGYISSEMVGLSIAYAVMVSTFFNWSMRSISEFEMWFNSVERVSNYTNIDQEEHPKEHDEVSSAWPEQGSIRYDKVSLRYDVSLDPVIKDFSINIPHGHKVGICGRTGCGKTSLTLSLFSLIDICEGHIYIDDVDIKTVPLSRLRSALAIIPQDPVLFSGSIRFNLDPEGIKTDNEVWQALEIAQLKDTISQCDGKLESVVTEGGENFSVGQRQLFCLARAFLRNSRILVMDEATASIDLETDNVIQNVVKTAFEERTVITIAHRISTIMKCDIILVIHEGRLIEQDSPQNLMDRDSVFAAMVKQHEL